MWGGQDACMVSCRRLMRVLGPPPQGANTARGATFTDPMLAPTSVSQISRPGPPHASRREAIPAHPGGKGQGGVPGAAGEGGLGVGGTHGDAQGVVPVGKHGFHPQGGGAHRGKGQMLGIPVHRQAAYHAVHQHLDLRAARGDPGAHRIFKKVHRHP